MVVKQQSKSLLLLVRWLHMIHFGTRYISFGRGDICVGNYWSSLTFQNIRPAAECGTALDCESVELIDSIIEVPFSSIQDFGVFERKLKKVEQADGGCFEFKGWKFYFIQGSKASIAVVSKHFNLVLDRMLPCFAC